MINRKKSKQKMFKTMNQKNRLMNQKEYGDELLEWTKYEAMEMDQKKVNENICKAFMYVTPNFSSRNASLSVKTGNTTWGWSHISPIRRAPFSFASLINFALPSMSTFLVSHVGGRLGPASYTSSQWSSLYLSITRVAPSSQGEVVLSLARPPWP